MPTPGRKHGGPTLMLRRGFMTVGEESCDLIVMGTQGRSGLGHLLMGSVAEAVLRKARCPVLTVRTPAAESSAGLGVASREVVTQ
jgi:hypothetical protein